jgi:hypothetical protein
MDIITLDFETFYSKEFSLSKITTEEYVRDPRFQVIGVGVQVNHEPPQWFSGKPKEVKEFLDSVAVGGWDKYAVLAHNMAFDGAILGWRFNIHPKVLLDTLSMARAIRGTEVSNSLANLAKHFGLPDKGTEVVNAMGLRRDDFTPAGLAAYGEYCKHDVELCRELFDRFMGTGFKLLELKIIDLTLRMFTDPVLELDSVLLQEHLITTQDAKAKLLVDAGVTSKKSLMSNPQFAALLAGYGVEAPMKLSPTTGKWTHAFSKTDEEFLALQDHPTLEVQTLVAARLGTKSTLEETRTQRLLDISFRGNFPVPLTYYAAHCLTGDAEVLTRNGWERLDAWAGSDIMQWEPDGAMRFAEATPNKFFVVDEPLVGVTSHYHNAVYTAGHTIPKFSARGKFSTAKAGDLVGKRFELPISGVADGGASVTAIDAMVAAMVQADGSVSTSTKRGRSVRFGFKRERKVTRCKALLDAVGVAYTVSVEPSGATRIRVPSADVDKLLRLVEGQSKAFSNKLLDAPLAVKKAFLEELSHWDGSTEAPGSISYTTTNRENALMVQTIAHLCGHAAHVALRQRGTPGWNPTWRVYVRGETRSTRIMPEHSKLSSYTGAVYCPTTRTGYFLFRQNGCVAVTGNTGRWGGADKINLQNLPSRGPNAKKLKKAIIAPEGYVLIDADSSQIEARVLAWWAGQDDLVLAFANREDVYVKMAASIYSMTEDEVFTEVKAGNKTKRQVGKTTILGAGYGMGGPKFQHTLATQAGVEVSEDEATEIIQAYRSTYPAIKALWDDANTALKQMINGVVYPFGREGVVTVDPSVPGIRLPNGLFIRYTDLSWHQSDDGRDMRYKVRKGTNKIYGGKVVENVCQALARCIIAEQMVKISKRYRVVMTVHDSIIAMVKEEEAQEAQQYIEACMRWTPDWAEGLPLDCESGIGTSYGDC